MIELQSEPPTPNAGVVDWLYSASMGLVEGLTEFLPISSTGHLIIVGQGIFRREDASFDIGIQIGAISAILVLYRVRLWRAGVDFVGGGRPAGEPKPRVNLLWLIFAAALPAAALGLWLEDPIEELLFNPTTVATTMVVGGVLLLVLEAWESRRGVQQRQMLSLYQMSVKQAVVIGFFQSLALIPGTSRSGSMIAGAMVVGFKRTTAAEFSFLVGLPILYGASLLKLFGQPEILSTPEGVIEFSLATATSFLSALIVVKPFVRFLQNHTFRPFAWYRIAVGGVLLGMIYAGWI